MKKEHRDRIKKAMADLLKYKDKSSTTSLILVSDEGDEKFLREPCHGALSYPTYKGLRIGVVSGLQEKYKQSHGPGKWSDTTDAEKVMYLDWLLKRSPYASAFLYKSGRNALKNKCVVVRANVPSNVMAGGLVASRRLWEYSNIAVVWCDLVKEGVDESLAFYLAHLARSCPTRKGSISWDSVDTGHKSLDACYMSAKDVKRLLDNTPVTLNDNWDVNAYYQGYSGMFTKDRARGAEILGTRISTLFDKAAVPVDVKNNNPFLAAGVVRRVPYAEGIKVMAELAKTVIIEEVMNA